MKIVLYTYQFPRFSETFIARQFLYLLKQNVDVHIVARKSEDEQFFPEVSHFKKNIHYLPNIKKKYIIPLILPFLIFKTLFRKPLLTIKYFKITVKRYGIIGSFKRFYSEYPILIIGPDIVHFEYITIAREHIHLKDILKFRSIASFRGHGITYVGIEDPDFYTETFNKLDAIHTISDYLIRFAEKHRGLDLKNAHKRIIIKKIPPAIDESLLNIPRNYRSSNGVSTPVRILTVGRLHWTKGYEYTLKAMQLLKEKGYKIEYHIIGDGNLKEMVLYLIDFLQLHDVVELKGKLSFRETLEEYKWADIFLIGSIEEGFCNAVLEAQALGLPSVVTDAPALLENVIAGKTALVAERRNPFDIARKLEELITNPEKRKQLGHNAREHVKNKFILDKQAEEFFKLYKEILEHGKD